MILIVLNKMYLRCIIIEEVHHSYHVLSLCLLIV